MKLSFNLDFNNLDLEGLKKLDQIFLSFLLEGDKSLYNDILFLRSNSHCIATKHYSDFLLKIAPFLDDFLAELFNISKAVSELRQQHKEFDVIYECKRKFIQRYALKKYPIEKIKEINFENIFTALTKLLGENFTSKEFAKQVIKWQLEEEKFSKELDVAAQYAVCRVYGEESEGGSSFSVIARRCDSIDVAIQKNNNFTTWNVKSSLDCRVGTYVPPRNDESVLFTIPQKLDKDNLIDPKKIAKYQTNVREGFDYFDPSINLNAALNHAHYCIYCHKQEKDSCSKGFVRNRHCEEAHSADAVIQENYSHTELVSGANKEMLKQFQHDEMDSRLRGNDIREGGDDIRECGNGIKRDRNDIQKQGCPLKQKISEMNYVKAQGFNLAALAIIVIDNPMVAATGHKICNDCAKSCIYQKQEPVNIPLIESNILEETLNLPYGLEIYLLLTRWNPLNIIVPLPQESTGYNVLVTGLGPAGFSLSYYLLRSGHNVVAIDGLKISPLPFDVNEPVKYWAEYKQRLSERIPKGFGGVTEYGITSRWDKNNLDILRLILERNNNFKYYSAVRLGSNITTSQAFELGFDHIAFCSGAGQPKIPETDNFTANFMPKGVKTASDFLMTLQSSGAFLEKSITNMVIRMPIVIIGGGLTSLDAATESFYYYKMQVVKFFANYELAVKKHGKAYVEKDWTLEDKEIAEEFISHAKLFKEANSRQAIREIFTKLGGITIYYRGELKNSPAYKLNHEELLHAMAVGINFVENMQLRAINVDKYDYVESVEYRCHTRPQCHSGNGGNPEKMYMDSRRCRNDIIQLNSERVRQCEFKGEPAQRIIIREHRRIQKNSLVSSDRDDAVQVQARTVIMAVGTENAEIEPQEERYSYFGDCDRKYAGSVVKALASSKEGYENINKRLDAVAGSRNDKLFRLAEYTGDYKEFFGKLDYLLNSKIEKINILSDKIVELVIHSPLAAQNFKPGQFFRLQNYSDDVTKLMEPLALTGAYVDLEKNLIHLIILESGQSSNLCRHLSIGESIALMGPTGAPTEILKDSNVVLVGGGLGNAVLLSIGQALKKNNCRITYFAGYKKLADRFYAEKIEEIADRVIWCYEEEQKCHSRAGGNLCIKGTVIDGIKYVQNQKAEFPQIDRIIAIGSAEMMEAVSNIKDEVFGKSAELIVSVNASMQCMMKGVCGQCVQKVKGDKSYIFVCSCQDQNAEIIDFPSLKNRLQQNSLQEKLQKLE
nr:palindromic element RPE3 domain-containing protein [Rickettsia endosymbiont of Ceutorhynchus assimilis]